MNASVEWLRAFVPVDASPARVRELLTAHTATVDELVPLRQDLAPIVVARVTQADRHPDSDHLWVTKVDAGGKDPVDVVCGAPNVTAGALYPFAPVGTTMPNGMKIERRKIRGVVSNGMLCSARELGLGEAHEGILELTTEAAPGTPLLDVVPAGDVRLVIDTGANRPDLLSHLGVARELGAVTGVKMRMPEIPNFGPATPTPSRVPASGQTGRMKIAVESDTGTRRYMAAVIRGVAIGASPAWLTGRLASVGVRSINNVVDATNYVLHEMGQPIHAFDAATLAGGELVVRLARSKETITTLDGIARPLPSGAVVIADATRAQAVAGVMGGRESEVTAGTRDLLIEVASFDPKRTRAARRALGLITDASYRFERGVDPALGPSALDRVLRLILSLAGGTLADAPVDVYTPAPPSPDIGLRVRRVHQVLGIAIPLDRVRGYLEAAGFGVQEDGAGAMSVSVPTWRADVVGEVDLIEEIARFHGYDAFPSELRPFRPTTTLDDPAWTLADRVRTELVGLGLYEARPMPFVRAAEESHVRISNPLSENEGFLRTSVLETLERRAEYNLSHQVGDVRLFEIGTVFARGASAVPREELRIGAIVMGRRRPPHFSEPQPPAIDEWDAKGIAERVAAVAYPDTTIELTPGKDRVLWRIRQGDRALGHVSRLALDAPVWASPAFGIEVRLSEVDSEPAAPRGSHIYMEGHRPVPSPAARYRPVPTMPSSEVDLALLVPGDVEAAAVERVISAAAGDLLERLELFDQYTGEGVESGHRSLAWRLTFRHPERTLRDKEIEGRRAKIVAALERELHVRHRTA